MHVDITLKTEKYGIFTIMYDGVQFVAYDSKQPNLVQLKLKEDYSVKGLKLEYQCSTRPYIHLYDCMIHLHISEV